MLLLEKFNEGLHEMRELFHGTGRLEDSNSKLDEITKLLCLEIVSAQDDNTKVPSLSEILNQNTKDSLVESLNNALLVAANSKLLTNYDGDSLLGQNPKFNLSTSEGALAQGLVKIVIDSFNGYLRKNRDKATFDFLNEAFGHFIRENFRQNIEDAQYMTPHEAVCFMVNIGYQRVLERNFSRDYQPVICDPSCGVGSFLAQFYRKWAIDNKRTPPLLIGQDKVDRMARLSILNLALFGINDSKIFRGNSLIPQSPLDDYNEGCDLILTNPPFGARFDCFSLSGHSSTFFPFLNKYITQKGDFVDSEMLFLDRYLSLLKPGGTVLAVLPDSVISSLGLPNILRENIHRNWQVRSITELPAVTFAQAGTRTKTCILEIRKAEPSLTNFVYMGYAKSLGFEVSSKKGVPYKKLEGNNDLVRIEDAFLISDENKFKKTFNILASDPSVVAIPYTTLINEGWTPSHYSADRLSTIEEIRNLSESQEFTLMTLDEISSVVTKTRRGIPKTENSKCISVLHVGDFGSLNVREFLEYKPKTSGRFCTTGDILFSKINPRIPRCIVVPDLPHNLTCSTEFEVLQPKAGFSSHEIMLLLLSENAQKQIQSLTSGTSSSHNRIKTKELLAIKFAIPKIGTQARKEYERSVERFTEAHKNLNYANLKLFENWEDINRLFQSK